MSKYRKEAIAIVGAVVEERTALILLAKIAEMYPSAIVHAAKDVVKTSSNLLSVVPKELEDEVIVNKTDPVLMKFCRMHGKIACIRMWRFVFQYGLKEAKDAVEEFQARNGFEFGDVNNWGINMHSNSPLYLEARILVDNPRKVAISKLMLARDIDESAAKSLLQHAANTLSFVF